MLERLKKLVAYGLDRLKESSTIQGIASIATLAGGYVVNEQKMLAWTALAVTISQVLKIILPDDWTKP